MKMAEDAGSVLETEFVMVLRNYKESKGKPCEISIEKGDYLKLINCQDKDLWQVEIDNHPVYVPAKYLKITPRRKSVRIQKRKAVQYAEVPEDLIVEPEKRAKNCKGLERWLFEGAARKDGKSAGPSDIIKAPGLNKIAVFVPKQEKLEPPNEESESDAHLSHDFALVNVKTELESPAFEIPNITFVKEELILEETPSRKTGLSNILITNVMQLPDPVASVWQSGPVPAEVTAEEVKPFGSPLEILLAHPKWLQVILGCFKDDPKTLKNVRLVNSFWKKSANYAFRLNPSLLPTITTGEHWRGYNWTCRFTRLTHYLNCVKPSSGFPLKVVIYNCTRTVMTFLKDYAGDIADLKLVCLDPKKFKAKPRVPMLPALEKASFEGHKLVLQEDPQFSKEFLMWKALIGDGEILRTYIEDLSYQGGPVAPEKTFFEVISADQELPKLKKLQLTRPPQRPQNDVFLNKRDQLTKITLGVTQDFYFGPMKKLEVLKLTNGITFSDTVPLSGSLPSLRKVTVEDTRQTWDCRTINSLTRGDGVFENVVELNMLQTDYTRTKEETKQEFTKVVTCFPNLTKLEWRSKKNLGQVAIGAYIIFANLEYLRDLEIFAEDGDGSSFMKLLTGLSLEEIPMERQLWPGFLDGKSDAVCNLKRLKYLKLAVNRLERVVVPVLESEFLFEAGFKRMEALKNIEMRNVGYFGVVCHTSKSISIMNEMRAVMEWNQSGRKVVFK